MMSRITVGVSCTAKQVRGSTVRDQLLMALRELHSVGRDTLVSEGRTISYIVSCNNLVL